MQVQRAKLDDFQVYWTWLFLIFLGDPNWEPPENYEDSDFDDSVISEDEIADLVESLKQEVRIAEIYPEKVN